MHRSNPSRGSLALRLVVCLGALLMLAPLLGISSASAQNGDADEVVIFVLDLSGSMNEPFDADRTKLDVAKVAFSEAFANVSPDARVGLRTYGDQIEPTSPAEREASCTTDTRVVAPVAPLQREQLIAQVQGFSALGDTPMGLALQQASTDIPAGSTGTIVLFSDGRDECFDADLDGDPAVGPSFGQDPCATAQAITSGNSAVDRVVTVGFRADTAAEIELRCIADSTGGTYTSIETPEDARNALPELLVQLSAPREAQRLVGREIRGTTDADAAPELLRLDEVGADKVLYTDSIAMNTERFYRMPSYGPSGGTFTATVFGLPPEQGITLDMRIFVPSLDQRFFEGQHGDSNAGLPARPTASIRCTDCQITGGPHDALFIVTLTSEGEALGGTYELEILTEGPGFGGPTTSCSAPQACFYPQEIIDLTAQREAALEELNGDIGELAPPELIEERDRLLAESDAAQEVTDLANARAEELEERIPLAPIPTNSYRLPIFLMLAGAGLALAPVQKFKRAPKDPSETTDGDGDDGGQDEADTSGSKRKRRKNKGSTDESESDGAIAMQDAVAERTGPSLDDLGPAPAVSPNLKADGNNWDAELEAAKAALAQQRPERPTTPGQEPAALPTATSAAPASAPATPAPATPVPAAPAPEAVASVAAAGGPPAGNQFTPEQHAAAQAAAQKIAAQRAQEQAQPAPVEALALEMPPAIPAPAQASTQPADTAATEAAQAEQAAAERAAQAAAEQATAEAAAQQLAAQEQAAQQAEAAQRAAQEQAAADKAAADKAAADRAAEQAAQAAAAQAAAEKAAAEQAARLAAEKAAAEKATAERAAAEQAAQAAAAQAAAEKAAAAAAQKAAAERAAAEKAAAAAAAQKAAAERAAAERAAAEQAAREQAARLAAEKAAAEAAARAAAERAAAEQAAREQAARLAAEKAAAEAAARAAAQQAAADRAAAEKAAAERAAAEQATAIAVAQAAAQRAAAEQAAAARAAAEKAAAEAAALRQAAEQEAAAAAQAAALAAAGGSASTAAMTEEEQRQEARRRMLAKQNIVASSSSDGSAPVTPKSTAGTSAALRPLAAPAPGSAASAPAQAVVPEAPGWYQDPAIVGQFRWWDGTTWTGHTAATNQEPAPS